MIGVGDIVEYVAPCESMWKKFNGTRFIVVAGPWNISSEDFRFDISCLRGNPFFKVSGMPPEMHRQPRHQYSDWFSHLVLRKIDDPPKYQGTLIKIEVCNDDVVLL